MTTPTWFLAALTIALLGLGVKTTNAQVPENLNGFMSGIRANAVKGAVIFERGEGYYELLQGRTLEPDDVIKSGADSYYELLLQPGNYLRGSPGTELRIINDQVEKTKLKLSKGALNVEIVTKINTSSFYNPKDAYELIRVITPDAEVFISGPGIYRINARNDGRTELIVRKGEAVINGQFVKKERRAVTASQDVTVAEINLRTEDSFDVWSRERADTLVQSNKLLKKSAPWSKHKKATERATIDLPKEEPRSGNPYIVYARPGTVSFVEPGVEFSRPQKEWEALTEKSQLEPGDKVRTSEHSFAELTLFPDTHLRLGEASEVLFEQLSTDSVLVKLLRGSAILDVARFGNKLPPQIKLTGRTDSASIADNGNYRIDADALTIRDGKVIFNERSVDACRKISSGVVSDCDKKRTDNFDFWSRHRGEGQIHNGMLTVSTVTYLARLRQQRFRHAGFWFQNFGQLHYTFVPFTSLLFKSPYGGSYSTAMFPNADLRFVESGTRSLFSSPHPHQPPPMPGPPRPSGP